MEQENVDKIFKRAHKVGIEVDKYQRYMLNTEHRIRELKIKRAGLLKSLEHLGVEAPPDLDDSEEDEADAAEALAGAAVEVVPPEIEVKPAAAAREIALAAVEVDAPVVSPARADVEVDAAESPVMSPPKPEVKPLPAAAHEDEELPVIEQAK